MMRRSMLLGGLMVTLASAVRAGTAPVVLELFTSQGCSSCPPAEALLGELLHQPEVIALAWHVDYWNGLGWRDPYASARWTERQRRYAARLGEEVYTPALVVNGARMVIGSDRAAVREAMAAAPPLPLLLGLTRRGRTFEATVGPVAEPVGLTLAAYDPEQVTRVDGGENGGRRLREYHIVRDLHPVGSAGTMTFPMIALDQGIVLLAHDCAGRLLGAASAAPGR